MMDEHDTPRMEAMLHTLFNAVARQAGVVPSALDDAWMRFTRADPNTSLEAWLQERRTDRPNWWPASTGGGTQPERTTPAGTPTVSDVREWSDAQKVAYLGTHGLEEYEALLRKAFRPGA